ncbi:MAG: chorismate synthase [Candidatus Latescibacterota bacterium]|nr:chorismate synthase [Candidatus Latescibacterota bacterium]
MELLGGRYFSVGGAGESHGPGITSIVYGCPAGLRLSRQAIQCFLDRRRPGSSKLGTPRRERDRVVLLSGLYNDDHDALLQQSRIATTDDEVVEVTTYEEGVTSGEPIAALVLSAAKRSADYDQFLGERGEARPGHTDLVKHFQSQGHTDPRGGGRSSYRSTITDVVGGSVARLLLEQLFGTRFLTSICQVGELVVEQSLADWVWSRTDFGRLTSEQLIEVEGQLEANEESAAVRSIDAGFAASARELITRTRKEGNSIGAAVEVVGVNVPALAGAPLYNSLKLRLMGALGGMHAVQSCEMGSGLDVVMRTGSENNDRIRTEGYQSNHHGGLLGGITTGNPLHFRVGFKPTSSITMTQDSVRKNLENVDYKLRKGRHDPCVGIRAGVTLESRMAIELLDAVMAHQATRIDPRHFRLFDERDS